MRGGAGEVTEHIVGETCLDALIGAVQLGPGFLHDKHPELVAVGLGEAGSEALVGAGEEIVDDDVAPLPVLANLDRVDAVVIDGLGDEQFADAVGVLG